MNMQQRAEKSPEQQLSWLQKVIENTCVGRLGEYGANTRLQLYSLLLLGAQHLPDKNMMNIMKHHVLHDPVSCSQETQKLVMQHFGPTGHWNANHVKSSLGKNTERFMHRLALWGLLGNFEEKRLPRLHDVEIPMEGLPENLNGFSIIQISDLHLNALSTFCTPELLEDIVYQINDAVRREKGIVVFTGDLFSDATDGQDTDLVERSRDILGRIKAEKYAVLGNHDYITGKGLVKRILSDSGFSVLSNEASGTIEVGNTKLQFSGAGSLLFWDNNTEKAMSQVNADVLVHLFHEPQGIVDAMRSQCDVTLALCGHTHGKKKPHEERVSRLIEEALADIFHKNPKGIGLTRDKNASSIYGSNACNDFEEGFYRWNHGQREGIFGISPGIGSIYTPNQRSTPSSGTRMILRRK